ncbi:MICOS complex subunit MIC25 [Cylas formicarius]|uniref:MICOS complex subunit MIC25 n=1 Tax=Cylas formicarius TaxID=197179 RepID=UPI002958701A|nr:MICOS complex subunit MIC25 [Cylas formicarius]
MGSGPSKTRMLTVENDDPTSVIKVSDDVVDRIKGLAQTAPRAEPQQATVQPVYVSEPSTTSLEIRRSHVAELSKNDEYWAGRLKHVEDSHRRMNQVMQDEYQKALDEYKEPKRTQSLKEIPCLDSKRAVIECYRRYPGEPLRCAKVVQAFQECVDFKTHSLLAGK